MSIELPVYTVEGEKTERVVQLAESVFGIQPNMHVIYLDVKRYLASQHRGTHKTKTRGEVQASKRKIRPQKYTGQARLGQRSSPVLRGGGVAHGPRPRDYSIKLNKKVVNLARRSALSLKLKMQLETPEQTIFRVIEDFSFEEPKTKKMVRLLTAQKASDRFTILLLPEPDRIIYLSGRNIPYLEVIPFYQLNTYLVSRAYTLLFTESAIKKLEALLLAGMPQKQREDVSV